MNSNFYIPGNSDQGDISRNMENILLKIMKLKFVSDKMSSFCEKERNHRGWLF